MAEHKKIPLWMFDKNNIQTNKIYKTNFLTKTLKALSAIMQNELFSEVYAQRKGYLQLIDPRVKLVSFLFFMVFAAVTKSFITLIFLAFISFSFAFLSKLAIKQYLKRVWLVLPVIVFVFSIPAAFYYGWLTVIKMVLRTGVSISFAYLLFMTTRWQYIAKAFEALKVPPLIIAIFNMTYRYIFLISKIASEMIQARFLRTVTGNKSSADRAFVTSRISILFIKANYLSEEIYSAMRCRGYSGRIAAFCQLKINKTDVLWIVNNALIILVLILGELLY